MSKYRHENYDLYSDDIREAMRLANRAAKLSLSPSIGVSHLMLGMLHEPTGLAGHVLRQKYGKTRKVRRAIRKINNFGRQLTLLGKLPMAEETHVIIDHAVNFANINGHASVGSGTVLLVILQHDDIVTDDLSRIGFDVERMIETLPIYLDRLMNCPLSESIQLDL